MLPATTVGLVFGIWLFQQQPRLWSFSLWAIGLGCLSIAWLLAHHTRHVLPGWQPLLRRCACLLLVAILGFAWAQGRAWHRLQTSLPPGCELQVVNIQGVIVSVPEQDARGQHVEVAVEHSANSACPMPDRVRLHLYQQSYRGSSEKSAALPTLHAGERWQWHVRLKRPHGTRNPHGFDYAAWCLANQIGASGAIVSKAPMHRIQRLAWQPSAWIARSRELIGRRIDTVLGNTPSSAVIRALVIGDDSRIDRQDWQLFVDAGINHLVSISGLHITMLASLGYLCIGWLWRLKPGLALWLPSRLAAGAGGALVATGYAALAGFSIPTQRTLYMLLTVFVMLAFKQRLPFSWVLSIAVCIVLLLDPWAVLSPGFWLSFGAVAILAFAMGGRLQPERGWRAAWRTQWVITLAFVPVLILLFNQLSLISPLANGFAIPLVSLAIVPLAIAGAILPLDFLLQLAATLWEWCAYGLHWLRQLPGAVCYLPTPPLWAWLLAMAGMLVWLLPRGWPLRRAGLILWLPLFLPAQPTLQPGQMRVTVLDVGQGLSVLVQTAHHNMLYDAGPAYNEESDAGQRIVLPYLRHLGIRHLDKVIISHDDNDHSGGMASVLAGVPVGSLLSSLTPEADFFRQLQTLPHVSSFPRYPCYQGQHWQWDKLTFQVLSPAKQPDAHLKDNDKSCVIKVTSVHGSLLLTGDIERLAERRLLESAAGQLASTVITMPHHGSKTSSTMDFVAAAHPQIAIATVGYLNRFGHPKAEVLSRYQSQGTQILRSDLDGAILMDFTSGSAPEVRRWRKIESHYWEM